MISCKNCSTEYEGKHCPQCGQRAKVKRITNSSVMEEIRERLFHLNQGFFFTFLELLRRPGPAIREYIEGKRVVHFKPVKFLLWATALNFLVFHLVGLDKDIIHAISEHQGAAQSAGARAFQAAFSQYIFDHPAIIIFLLIPNIAFFSWWYFRKQGYNYAEHFVLNAYLMGQVSLFGIALNPLSKLAGTEQTSMFVKTGLSALLWIGYVSWGYIGFFQPQRKKWLVWIKSVLAIFSGYMLMLVVISILIALFVILFWTWLKPYFL